LILFGLELSLIITYLKLHTSEIKISENGCKISADGLNCQDMTKGSKSIQDTIQLILP
jgi:hypothetical protein